MAHTVPDLPTRFPCWCRATYSWGGETKRDLGFVEGDLIECLNAGDGSWWMGRLRRDKRAMGLFPSNFVQVLDVDFRPISRATSPMPFGNNGSSSQNSSPNSTPQKAKTFRKPFQAYTKAGSPNPPTKAAAEIRSRGPSPSPYKQQSSYTERPENSSELRNHSRHSSRVPSPAPSAHHRDVSTSRYSNHYRDVGSSPPPPAPPPHRVAYNGHVSRAPSPAPSMNDRYPTMSRGPSPAPPSPGPHGTGLTPSPLRDAMEDVMSSLHDMASRGNAPSPSPEGKQFDPWSPEAFTELHKKPDGRDRRRPRTSLGFGADEEKYQAHHTHDRWQKPSHYDEDDEAPYPDEYDHRLESHLQDMQDDRSIRGDELFLPDDRMGPPPAPPKKDSPYQSRVNSSLSTRDSSAGSVMPERKLRNRKSAYELGREMLGRTFTTKSNATNSSSGVQSTATNSSTGTSRTSQSIMSGYSASGFSATSAGSLARRKGLGSFSRSRPMSVVDTRQDAIMGLNGAAQNPSKGTSNYSARESKPSSDDRVEWTATGTDSGGLLGGLTTPKARKSGFFKKLVESAKTGAASARSSIAAGQAETARSPIKSLLPNGVTAIAGGNAARDMGLGNTKSGTDWVQVRRDVNRSNSPSRNERADRIERCQLMGHPVIAPIDALFEIAEGDEGSDSRPVRQPTAFQTVNFQLVDKSARFVNSLPPMTNPTSLAQGYVCRPYRSDVQRLRAIFTWVSEKVAWEEEFEGDIDARRVIQTRRGCAEEVAVLVMEMCSSIGLHAEVVRGYLKAPSDIVHEDYNPRPNHWWNAVIVENEWRIIDCSLASPTNPKRGQYSNASNQIAEVGWFLARPVEICYTHIPSLPEQQHICPPVASDILLSLPCACPPYFKNEIQLLDFDTSLSRLENLELVHVQFVVSPDIEVFAEVEARAYAQDADGDLFESGDTTTTRALAQAEWIQGQKRYTVKAFLPGDGGQGTLKVYSGKRGLMHSIKDNPHPLTFALPISHTGSNPPYEFFTRHPTPHALRHDLYVAQPQCARLAVNNTFVFAVRQHPASITCTSPTASTTSSTPSPFPFPRPSSALSMISSTTSSTDYFSQPPSSAPQSKPAKLAIQAPSGKILRLMRKSDLAVGSPNPAAADGVVWETIIKIGERGTWRGLVLADRSARWCVFGEWECV